MAPRSARPLGVFERAQYRTGEAFPFNLVTCVRLAGPMTEVRLTGALAELQTRHPLLRCAIKRMRGRPLFELDDEPPPIRVRSVARTADDAWRGEAEAELALPFDAGRAPLMRCTHVRGRPESGRHELLFTFHHSIVDAVAVMTLLGGVLELVAGAPESPAAAAPATSIPASTDQLLPATWRGLRARAASGRFLARQMADEVAYRWRTRGLRAAPAAAPFRCRVLPVVFGEAETATLVRATRRQRVSVWSALNAAMLLAVARHRHPGSSRPHRYFAFPLLRPHLEPPVGDDVVASHFSILRFTIEVNPETGLWELAALVHRQSDRAAKRGEKLLSMRWSELTMKALLRRGASRMGTVAVSYAGAVELEPRAAALGVEGLHAFVSNFPPGPEFTAQARLFRRRLWLDVLYLDVDMGDGEAAALAAEVRGRLAEAVARVGEGRA